MYAGAVAEQDDRQGLKDRLSRQGEEALGRLAEELAANPIVSSAVAGAFEARERAVAAQEAAMGALGIPSSADIERLTRRVRSVSQRLEGIEDAIDRLDARLATLGDLAGRLGAAADGSGFSAAVERSLDELKADVAALREQLAPGRPAASASSAKSRPRSGKSRSRSGASKARSSGTRRARTTPGG